jgi:hypothetical protein
MSFFRKMSPIFASLGTTNLISVRCFTSVNSWWCNSHTKQATVWSVFRIQGNSTRYKLGKVYIVYIRHIILFCQHILWSKLKLPSLVSFNFSKECYYGNLVFMQVLVWSSERDCLRLFTKRLEEQAYIKRTFLWSCLYVYIYIYIYTP